MGVINYLLTGMTLQVLGCLKITGFSCWLHHFFQNPMDSEGFLLWPTYQKWPPWHPRFQHVAYETLETCPTFFHHPSICLFGGWWLEKIKNILPNSLTFGDLHEQNPTKEKNPSKGRPTWFVFFGTTPKICPSYRLQLTSTLLLGGLSQLVNG